MMMVTAPEELELSQEKFAELVKLRKSVIGLVERSMSATAFLSFFAIADALEMQASRLATRADELTDGVPLGGAKAPMPPTTLIIVLLSVF